MIRSNERERLDEADIPEKDLLASLLFMRRVNRFFWGARVILDYFSSYSVPDHFSVLDIGTGSGDIPYALSRWATCHHKKADITAIDTHASCIAYAQKNFKTEGLFYKTASAFDLEALGKFDFIISSMFFHHLTDEEIVRLLVLVHRNAKKGFIINDLYRSRIAYAGAAFLAFFSFKNIVMNDATLSVKRSFTEEDFVRYARLARIPESRIQKKPVFRIELSHYA